MKSFFENISFPFFQEVEKEGLPFWKVYQLSLGKSSLAQALPKKLPFFVALPERSFFFYPFRFIPSFASFFFKKKNPNLLIEGEEERKKEDPWKGLDLFPTLEGVLVEKPDGALYLEAPSFLSELFASQFSLSTKAFFILVMTAEEKQNLLIDIAKELGKKFSFSLQGFFEVDISSHKKTLQFCKISSKSLESFREQYLLSKKPKGRDFFIPIKIVPLTNSPLPSLRINQALLSA